jgi:putative DNA-invertase from lambdoid prophage Rac
MQQAVRDSLIAFMAATAQSQGEVTKEAQKTGIAHARAMDGGAKYRGRKPTFSLEQFRLVRDPTRSGHRGVVHCQDHRAKAAIGLSHPSRA